MTVSIETQRTTSDILSNLGEPFAAGFLRQPNASMVERFADALKEWAGAVGLRPYDGELLYPSGTRLWDTPDMSVGWYYVTATPLNRGTFQRKYESAAPEERAALDELEAEWTKHVFPGGYTHSIPHYGRLLTEGLDGYADRVEAGMRHALRTEDVERAAFYRAMETTLDTARILHRRIVAELMRYVPDTDEQARRRDALMQAYHTVPFRRPGTFFEAAVATNFLFYFDGCDDLGRYDQYLGSYYDASIEHGDITRDAALDLVRAQWKNVDDATAWNTAIGGMKPDGTDLSNELTVVCIEAARGMRRPNLALRLGESTPDTVWDAALDTIRTGCGLPALYWDPNYFAAMDASDIPIRDCDRHEYAFGGCTELMVQGRSFVGSLDDAINLPEVLVRTVRRALPDAADFDEVYAAYRKDLAAELDALTARVNRWQEEKATWQPQPIRSLLIDDCIDRGKEYSAGGARYNWSVINVMGLANAVDSLAAIRELVFEQGAASGRELAEALESDFANAEDLRARLEKAPRYGNGSAQADALARDVSGYVFRELLSHRTWRGDAPFVPSCLMFVTYAHFGTMVGATADGRGAGTPIADSAGPYQGRDVSGPTAMLRSVAGIDQAHAPGTLVVNLRLSAQHFDSPEQREKTKALIRSYFDMGGMQIQVNTVDQEVLRDAVAHPERHGNLIVRVGGYSEYWSNLSPELRESILLRTEH